jgi:hypothetical protein
VHWGLRQAIERTAHGLPRGGGYPESVNFVRATFPNRCTEGDLPNEGVGTLELKAGKRLAVANQVIVGVLETVEVRQDDRSCDDGPCYRPTPDFVDAGDGAETGSVEAMFFVLRGA